MSSDYLASIDRDVVKELKVGGRTCWCAGCGEWFTGEGPFDRHLIDTGTADPHCRTRAEMRDIGMVENSNGVWQSGTSKRRLEAA